MDPEIQKKIDGYLLCHALLEYTKKEQDKTYFDYRLRLEAEDFDDFETIVGLEWVEDVPKTGRQKFPGKKYKFSPNQSTAFFNTDNQDICFLGDEGELKFGKIRKLQPAMGEVTIVDNGEISNHVTAITIDDWKHKEEHQDALMAIVRDHLNSNSVNSVASALIRRELPNETGENFKGSFESIFNAVSGLENSYFPVQGPPGAGKTYVGAHLIHHLITTQNKRVGIVSQSWSAIDNLLKKTLDVFEKEDLDRYKGRFVRNSGRSLDSELTGWQEEGILKIGGKKDIFGDSCCLAASTSWLWAGHEDEESKFDYLVIDEAGQFSLADALSVTRGAHNLVLLGDPQQLAQVSKASHSFGADVSVLEYVVGPRRVIEENRGSFLGSSYRMRPEVCQFISEEFYESYLKTADARCSLRTIENDEDGLRSFQIMVREINGEALPDRVINSIEEARQVKEVINSLKGKTWTDVEEVEGGFETEERKLLMENFMVMAPYRAQVSLIRSLLEPDDFYFEDSWSQEEWATFQEFENDYNSKDSDKRKKAREWWNGQMAKIVGTVDKFQGREAPVVIYSLTTSREDLIPAGRGDFIFSPNRLNVAISRAQCLAVLIGTEELVNSQAKTIEQMEALNHLCRFFEDRETTTVDGRMMIGETI